MMKRSLLTKLLLVVLGVVGIALLLPCVQSIKWVGHTDLEIRFSVTDGKTGAPIKDATIHILAEPGGFCEEREKRRFTLVTDENGQAKYLCKSCMCFGSKSAFEDTFAVHLPWWWFHATAPGYLDLEPEYLDVLEHAHRVKRGDGCATLDVKMVLLSHFP